MLVLQLSGSKQLVIGHPVMLVRGDLSLPTTPPGEL